MGMLLKLSRLFAAPVDFVGRYAAWLSIPLMGVIIFDVITRRFLVLGSTKLQEMEWHLHAMLFLLCLGFAYLRDAHVRIELIHEKMAPKTRHLVELGGTLLFLIPYCLIVIYWGIEYAQRSFRYNEVSAALTGLPFRWIIKSMVVAGFALLLSSGISVALKSLAGLLGADVETDHADGEAMT